MRIHIKTTTASSPAHRAPVVVRPASVSVVSRPMRVLDFDCEARPLHWISGDYVSKELTAIAWAWVDKPEVVTCYLLGESEPVEMLQAFAAVYAQADMVTGHFIRGYDLPLVNGAMTEYQLPILGDKLTHDTKLDLVKRSGLSGSQENLGAMLCLAHPKVKMNQSRWRDANRLTPSGFKAVRERVIGDVQQHIEMRQRLLELGYLGSPKVWRSNAIEAAPEYTP